MGNNERRNRGFFIRLTRGKAKEIIQKKEEKQGRKLNREERNRIIERVAKKARNKTAIYALIGTLGIGGSVAAGNVLGPGQNLREETNASTELNQKTDKEIFLDGIKIDVDALMNEETKDAQEEIDNLKTAEDVLNYVKEIYIEEYNEVNDTNIDIEDLQLQKNMADIVIYADEAENGDYILRYCSEYDAKEMGIRIDGDKSIISAFVETEQGRKVEKVAQNREGEYQKIYTKGAEVQQNEHTVLEEVADVVLTGINMSVSMEEKDNNSFEVNKKYRQDFIDAVAQYKNEKVQENTNEKIDVQQTQEDDGR